MYPGTHRKYRILPSIMFALSEHQGCRRSVFPCILVWQWGRGGSRENGAAVDQWWTEEERDK